LNSIAAEFFMEIILKELKLWLSEEGNQLKTRYGLTTEYWNRVILLRYNIYHKGEKILM
jgi:hypothetical protein